MVPPSIPLFYKRALTRTHQPQAQRVLWKELLRTFHSTSQHIILPMALHIKPPPSSMIRPIDPEDTSLLRRKQSPCNLITLPHACTQVMIEPRRNEPQTV